MGISPLQGPKACCELCGVTLGPAAQPPTCSCGHFSLLAHQAPSSQNERCSLMFLQSHIPSVQLRYCPPASRPLQVFLNSILANRFKAELASDTSVAGSSTLTQMHAPHTILSSLPVLAH